MNKEIIQEKQLIDEYRKRIIQLQLIEENFYFFTHVKKLFDWLLDIKAFEEAFDYLDELYLFYILAQERNSQNCIQKIRKIWNTIQKNQISLEHISHSGRESYVHLTKQINNELNHSVFDLIQSLQLIIKSLYESSQYKNIVLIENLVYIDNNGKISEYLPIRLKRDLEEFVRISKLMKMNEDVSPEGIFIKLKEMKYNFDQFGYEQIAPWIKMQVKRNYIYYLNAISNSLYDVLILRSKKKVDFNTYEELKVRNITFKYLKCDEDTHKLLCGDYGFVVLSPRKSSAGDKTYKVGAIIRRFINSKDYIVSGKDLDTISGVKSDRKNFIDSINRTFKQAYENRTLKAHLIIQSGKYNRKGLSKYSLTAYQATPPISLAANTNFENSLLNHHFLLK